MVTASFTLCPFLFCTTKNATFFSTTNLSPRTFSTVGAWLGQQPLPACLITINHPRSSLSFLFSLISPSLDSPPILNSSFILPSPPSPRRPTTAAGAPGVLGVGAPELAEEGCSSPSDRATTRRRVTTAATAWEREPFIGPAMSRRVRHQVSGTAHGTRARLEQHSALFVHNSALHFNLLVTELFPR